MRTLGWLPTCVLAGCSSILGIGTPKLDDDSPATNGDVVDAGNVSDGALNDAAPGSGSPPLTIVSAVPASGASAVTSGTAPSVTFSRAIVAATVTTSSFTVTGSSNSVAGSVSVSGATVTFRPIAPLALLTRYSAKITTAIRDAQNVSLAVDYPWNFTTRDGTWGSPNGIDNGQSNHVAFDANGHALVTFSKNAGSGYKVYASRYTGSGWTMAAAIEPTTQMSNAFDSSTGMDNAGNAVTVWTEYPNSGSARVWANRMAPNGTWGNAAIIDSGSASSYSLVAMNATGTAYAVWTFADGGGRKHIYGARYTLAGGWTMAAPISNDNSSDADNAYIAVDATGYGYAIWEQGGNILFSRYVSGWSAAVAIASGGSSDKYARIAVNASGAALATWNRGSAVMAASNPGSGWTGVRAISTSANSSMYPEVAIDHAGNGFVTWQVFSSSDFIQVLRFDATSKQWATAPQPAAPSFAGHAQEQIVLFDPSDNALLAWSEADGPDPSPSCFPGQCVFPNFQIRVNRYQASTNTWLGPVTLTSGSTNHWSPKIAIAPDGTAGLVHHPAIAAYLFR